MDARAAPPSLVPPLSSSSTQSPPSASRRPHRKHQDSFLHFASASDPRISSSEDQASNLSARTPLRREDGETDSEPFLRRLVMMPLISISFLLSLFLVQRSDRARRSSEHPSRQALGSPFWSPFALQSWLSPEPYQDPDDTTWRDADSSQGGSPKPKKRSWYVRKKLRQVGRMQIIDAFELRGVVMIALLALSVLMIVGVGWTFSKAYHGLMARLKR
ncbi:uncharacterized protein PV09_06841 [Verruconis gallopava]|uniref:Uncharacterized protein n=1 Tax=Verruconis gallopava TaxID=253628 RepID=A0A0D1XHF3_9PEZI|nr:uncharacterized protein PV09_06841 [Verruconis gallopava]KIW01656.1 hypothetical protein PV09_06841 [Verruconis gallopava]